MTTLLTKLGVKLLLLLSCIYFVNGETDCEDCCSILNAQPGLFYAGLSQLNIVIVVGFFIVMKKICKPEDRGQVWAITMLHIVLELTAVIWFVIDRVTVDCKCCADDRVQVIVLLSLVCVILPVGIFFNCYLSVRYRYWRHMCSRGGKTDCQSNNATKSYEATHNKA